MRSAIAISVCVCVLSWAGLARGLVLEDGDVLISSTFRLTLSRDDVLTAVAGLTATRLVIDSQDRVIFSAMDFSTSPFGIFRWDPLTGARDSYAADISNSGDLVLEDDSSLIFYGSSSLGTGLQRLDLSDGSFEMLSQGGFFSGQLAIALDPTDGSIVVASATAIFRVNPITGQQVPLLSVALNTQKLAIDSTGEIYVYSFTGSTTSPLSRLNTTSNQLDPVANLRTVSALEFDANDSLLALGEPVFLAGFNGLFRVDLSTGVPTNLSTANLSGSDIAVGSMGTIYTAGTGNTNLGQPFFERVSVSVTDPMTGVAQGLLYSPFSIGGNNGNLVGAVVRPAQGGGEELLVFVGDDILRVDPADGYAEQVATGGLLSPFPTTPAPIVARNGEVLFLNDQTSSLLALELDGDVRFISAGNLIDTPRGVIEEASGSLLVASAGFTNPGIARIEADGSSQASVLSGSALGITAGVVNPAVVLGSFPNQFFGISATDMMVPVMAQQIPTRLGSGPGGEVWGSTFTAELIEIDETDGSVSTVGPSISSASHFFAVPAPTAGTMGIVVVGVLAAVRRVKEPGRQS